MNREAPLAGKVAIVTGGARGIGLATAERLARAGATVVIGDIDGNDAVAAADALRPELNVHAQRLDITDERSTASVVATVEERFGRLDILINNAAIHDLSPFDELSYRRFGEVMRANLDGALLMSMAAVPAIERSGGGRIVNVASIMGLYAMKDSIPYSTAKGALVNLTRCLAVDLAGRNITVNAVAPGFIDTRMARAADGSHEHESETFKTVYLHFEKIPSGRAGLPEDVAGPIYFFCSDDSRYVTGQVLLVDGGVSATF
ncbi:MAG: SDR family oxidoreductase [Trueperaceae bacterium]|nr:MAG: SDR family oxidoreductase [Trueperaceae bacterium]